MTHDLTPGHDAGKSTEPPHDDADASAWDLDGVLAARRGEGTVPGGEPDERGDVVDAEHDSDVEPAPELGPVAEDTAEQDPSPGGEPDAAQDPSSGAEANAAPGAGQDAAPEDAARVAEADSRPETAHDAGTEPDEDIAPGAEFPHLDEQAVAAADDEQITPTGPTELADAAEPGEPADAAEPGEPADAAEPGEPADAAEPGEPADAAEPADLAAGPAPSEPADQPVEPEANEPVNPAVEPVVTKPSEPADAAVVDPAHEGTDALAQAAPQAPEPVPSPPAPDPDGPDTTAPEAIAVFAGPGTDTEQMPPTTQLRSSPLDQFEAEPARPRRRRGLVIALIMLLVLGGGYAAAALLLGDRLPNGTTVAGVPIGGLSEADARARLDTDLAAAQAELIPVTLQGEAVSAVDPAAVGLALDVDATLDPLLGPAFDPRILWGRIFGADAVPVVSTVDEEALRTALETAASELDISPVEGFITFAGTTPEVTDPVPGTAVDIDAAQQLLTREWLTAERPLELPSREVAPAVDAEAVQEALTTQAQPLVSGPVSVSVDGNAVELTPENLATNAVFVATDGALDLELDGAGLAEAVVAADPEVEVAGTDAEIILNANAEPQIVPSTSGMGLDPTDLAAAVETAGTSTDRTAVVALVEAEPEFTTADAEALGVKEIVADFSTPMPYDPVRTENLVVGSRYVTGVLVKPGEEFSLLKALGPIVSERGFVSSGVVEDGFSSTALGGGLSQLSTNMFNVGFIAGMDDVEHTPHSRWFQRYPAGREATLWEPSKDMIWRNNTDYGILVHAWVADGRVHTRLWSTKVWDVDITTSDHYNITQPDTKYNPREDCVAESGGQYGFTVTVTRERSRAGTPPESQQWTWTYQPWHRIVCGEPPSAQPTPTDTPPEGEPAPEGAA